MRITITIDTDPAPEPEPSAGADQVDTGAYVEGRPQPDYIGFRTPSPGVPDE